MNDDQRACETHNNQFATLSLLCFLLICLCVLALIATGAKLEAWAAGIIGSILGFWAGNLAQVFGFKYGASQAAQTSSQASRNTIDKMVDANTAAAQVLAEKVPTPPAPVAVQPVVIANTEPVDVAVVKPP